MLLHTRKMIYVTVDYTDTSGHGSRSQEQMMEDWDNEQTDKD